MNRHPDIEPTLDFLSAVADVIRRKEDEDRHYFDEATGAKTVRKKTSTDSLLKSHEPRQVKWTLRDPEVTSL